MPRTIAGIQNFSEKMALFDHYNSKNTEWHFARWALWIVEIQQPTDRFRQELFSKSLARIFLKKLNNLSVTYNVHKTVIRLKKYSKIFNNQNLFNDD